MPRPPTPTKNVVKVLVGTLYRVRVERRLRERIRSSASCSWTTNAPKLRAACAGVAAYCVNEFDLAETWLNAAKASGMLSKIGNEMRGPDGTPREYSHYPDMIELAKAGWPKEKKIREAEAKADDLPRVCMKTSAGDLEIELFEERSAEHGAELHYAGGEGFLRRLEIPPRDDRFHGPRRRPQGHRGRRTGLHHPLRMLPGRPSAAFPRR